MAGESGGSTSRFQHRFCNLFNDLFGAGFVERTHEPCSREDSGLYIMLYILEFTRLYLRSALTHGQIEHLRKKIAYERQQRRYPRVPD
ncbi:hypothetical protein ACQJBY_024074 [Aegilops geniculata]